MVRKDLLFYEQGKVSLLAVSLGDPNGFYLVVSRAFPRLVDPTGPGIKARKSSNFETVCFFFTYSTVGLPVT